MATTPKTMAATNGSREHELGKMLEGRRRELLHEVQGRIRDVRRECGDEIAKARLRALPLAVRCKDCEEARETAEHRERIIAQRRASSALFSGMSN